MAIATNFPSINPTLLLDFANSGRVDPRVTFTRASSATFFDQTGVLRTAATNVPRLDYDPSTLAARGFLIEESRTNSIRNNTMQGAATGTPGTLPTNWTGNATVDGLSREVVGTGTENGISYIDVRFSGTSGIATNATLLTFEGQTQVVAANGQTWTTSVYLKLAAGALTNIASFAVGMRYNNSGGTSVTPQNATLTPTASLTRYTNTLLATDATTAFVNGSLVANFTDSSAVDFTVRIGLPQLEQGAFATSVIPTTTTAVTRAVDVASVNTLSPWYNAAEGTFVAQSLVTGGGTNFVSRLIGAATNIYMANGYVGGSGAPTAASYLRNGAAAPQISKAIDPKVAGTVYKEATRYSSTSFREAANGTLGNNITPSAGIPTVSKLDFAAAASSLTSTAVGQLWLQRFTYYPRSFSDAELTSISA